MGQKIHPYGLRLGIIKPWQSRWYSKDQYRDFLIEDEKIRRFIRRFVKAKPVRPGSRERTNDPALSRIEIERQANRCTVKLHTAKPGVIIGQRGADIERLQKALGKFTGKDVRVRSKKFATRTWTPNSLPKALPNKSNAASRSAVPFV